MRLDRGGALAIGVGDRVYMLEYSIYSVISPEGCASILWKDTSKAAEAATAMGVTAKQVAERGLVDDVLKEPLGGAHRNVTEMSLTIKQKLVQDLRELQQYSTERLLTTRYQKFMAMGACE